MPKIKAVPAIIAALILAGCATQPPLVQTKVVEVPSSKPYRFITYSLDDTAETRRAIRAHNRAHQAVINAEKTKQ